MSKFHINAKGEPGKCSAEVQCPFGGESDHFSSPERAREAFETSQKPNVLPTLNRSDFPKDYYVEEPNFGLITEKDPQGRAATKELGYHGPEPKWLEGYEKAFTDRFPGNEPEIIDVIDTYEGKMAVVWQPYSLNPEDQNLQRDGWAVREVSLVSMNDGKHFGSLRISPSDSEAAIARVAEIDENLAKDGHSAALYVYAARMLGREGQMLAADTTADGQNRKDWNSFTKNQFVPARAQELRFSGGFPVTKPVLDFRKNLGEQIYDKKEAASKYVPRGIDDAHAGYYAATDAKHFGDKTEPGSKFISESLRSVEDVVALRMVQTGKDHLKGDDREALIAAGSDPNGFSAGKRYLMVKTAGTVGIRNSNTFKPEDKVQVVRTKPGAPCSIVATVKSQPETDYAVVVVGEHKDTKNDFIITTFPGPVTKPTANATIDNLEGRTMTVADARRLMGEDFWINTRVA